jgi:hypothetical protein
VGHGAGRGNRCHGDLTIPSVYVLGLGIGTCITSLCDVAIGDVTQDEAGSASGSFSAVQQLASAIGGVTAMTVSSFTVAMIIVACLGLVWLLPPHGCGRVSADAAAGPVRGSGCARHRDSGHGGRA